MAIIVLLLPKRASTLSSLVFPNSRIIPAPTSGSRNASERDNSSSASLNLASCSFIKLIVENLFFVFLRLLEGRNHEYRFQKVLINHTRSHLLSRPRRPVFHRILTSASLTHVGFLSVILFLA